MVAQLIARSVVFSHGPTAVLSGVSFSVLPGRRTGIVGPNGVGKSTLLRLLAGELTPDSGTVERHPPDATVGYLTQELAIVGDETIGQLIERRTGVADAQRDLDRTTDALAKGDPGADDNYSSALDRWLRLGAADLDARRDDVLGQVGLSPARVDQQARHLSGGQQARVGLAALLLSRFDVLLLDEPTNDLDAAGLRQLEEFVVSNDAGTAVVSHDRHFLDRVVTDVLEIDEHHRVGNEFGGGWQAYLEARQTARRHAEERHAGYVDEKKRLTDRAQRERNWATQGVSKEKKNPRDNDKAQRDFRLNRTEKMASRARQTDRAMDRLEVVEKPWEAWELQFTIGEVARPGDLVAELAGASFTPAGTSDSDAFTLGPIDLAVMAGDRVSITGPNGAGKTTLISALLGDVDLDHGDQRVGPSVVSGRLDQARRRFDSDDSLLDVFTKDTGTTPGDARGVLAKFGLTTEHVSRSTRALSPGERTRAVLAAFQIRGVNLLVLDEPTNHLDLPAIEQLEQALSNFGGTLLMISHDRAFLDAVSVSRRIELLDGAVVSDGPA